MEQFEKTPVLYFPIFVNKEEVDKEEQAEQINSIIQSMGNEYTDKTQQIKLEETKPYQIVEKISNYARDVIDYCYLSRNTISFAFNTTGIEGGSTTPIFSIKPGENRGEIQFLGLNDLDNFSYILNDFGYFTYTYNTLAGEQQISFIAYSDMPSMVFRVFMNFNYSLK